MMSTVLHRNTGEVLGAIDEILTPYVGKLIASTAGAAHCEKLGLAGSILDESQIEVLLEKLGLGLVIFLGQEKTDAVVGSMRSAITSLEEPR